MIDRLKRRIAASGSERGFTLTQAQYKKGGPTADITSGLC
jgi:hypothetical protein